MTKFLEAYKKVHELEGGYLKDSDGETYGGIARKFWNDSEIWGFVDKETPMKNNQRLKDKRAEAILVEFYLINFWNPYFEMINDQKTVTFIFSQFVNMGGKGLKLAQKAAGAKQDGLIGPLSVKAINEARNYLKELEYENIQYYNAIVMKNPSKIGNISGWYKRIDNLLI